MALTEAQKQALGAPLSSSHVKERSQSGRKFSYIEGWHAIAEANRIFGFDGWTRETLDVRCVAEGPREIGKDKIPGHSVSYICRVRVIAQGVAREGAGAGHGIDKDLGLAHESAIKEAETDAMKRALMTFGNPFGLALYDKTQAGVEDESVALSKAKARPVYDKLQGEIANCSTLDMLKQWGAAHKAEIATLPLDWQDALRDRYEETHSTLKMKEAA
jgi:DNA repair and recombination protein RAD52